MAGLNLASGLSFSGAAPAPGGQANYGSQQSYGQGLGSVNSAAFAGVSTDPTSGGITPSSPLGVGVSIGTLALVALAIIRYTLPD